MYISRGVNMYISRGTCTCQGGINIYIGYEEWAWGYKKIERGEVGNFGVEIVDVEGGLHVHLEGATCTSRGGINIYIGGMEWAWGCKKIARGEI